MSAYNVEIEVVILGVSHKCKSVKEAQCFYFSDKTFVGGAIPGARPTIRARLVTHVPRGAWEVVPHVGLTQGPVARSLLHGAQGPGGRLVVPEARLGALHSYNRLFNALTLYNIHMYFQAYRDGFVCVRLW